MLPLPLGKSSNLTNELRIGMAGVPTTESVQVPSLQRVYGQDACNLICYACLWAQENADSKDFSKSCRTCSDAKQLNFGILCMILRHQWGSKKTLKLQRPFALNKPLPSAARSIGPDEAPHHLEIITPKGQHSTYCGINHSSPCSWQLRRGLRCFEHTFNLTLCRPMP